MIGNYVMRRKTLSQITEAIFDEQTSAGTLDELKKVLIQNRFLCAYVHFFDIEGGYYGGSVLYRALHPPLLIESDLILGVYQERLPVICLSDMTDLEQSSGVFYWEYNLSNILTDHPERVIDVILTVMEKR